MRYGIVCLAVGVVALTANRAGADPDPVALLRGVQTSRESLHGKFVAKVTSENIRPPSAKARVLTLDIVFDRERRRVIQEETILTLNPPKAGQPSPKDQLTAIGGDRDRAVSMGFAHWEPTRTRIVYDGTQVMTYSEQGGAAIRAPSDPLPHICFDPRILGLSRVLEPTVSLDQALGLATGNEHRLLGREVMRGQSVWHVVFVRSGPGGSAEEHFWVEDREGFRVHQHETRMKMPSGSPVTERTELFYPVGGVAYPTKIVEHRPRPSRETRVTFDIESLDLGFTPDPSVFGYAGLELPAGEMVTDERLKRVAGYWNGEGLGADRAAAVKQAADLEAAGGRLTRRWLVPTAVAGVILVLLVLVWHRRRLRRSQSN